MPPTSSPARCPASVPTRRPPGLARRRHADGSSPTAHRATPSPSRRLVSSSSPGRPDAARNRSRKDHHGRLPQEVPRQRLLLPVIRCQGGRESGGRLLGCCSALPHRAHRAHRARRQRATQPGRRPPRIQGLRADGLTLPDPGRVGLRRPGAIPGPGAGTTPGGARRPRRPAGPAGAAGPATGNRPDAVGAPRSTRGRGASAGSVRSTQAGAGQVDTVADIASDIEF